MSATFDFDAAYKAFLEVMDDGRVALTFKEEEAIRAALEAGVDEDWEPPRDY